MKNIQNLVIRLSNKKNFIAAASFIQLIIDIFAWSAAAAFALVLRSYLQDEQNISTVVQNILYRVLPIVAVVQATAG